jgi:hypothetical protein
LAVVELLEIVKVTTQHVQAQRLR